MKFNIFLILLMPLTIQANLVKFPLYKIGVKFDKPKTHFLLTAENVKELKSEIFGIVKVCDASKISFEKALSNPNYQVLLNKDDYNEIITVAKLPHFAVNEKNYLTLKQELRELCLSFKNTSITYLSDNTGTLRLGNYISCVYKITTPEFSYYSEGFFIEGRNSTVLVTINTINEPNNQSLIESIENINSEEYDNIIEEFTKLYLKNDFTNALLKLSEAIQLEPVNVVAYERKIEVNIKLKNYNEALNDANIILNFDKYNVNAMLIKGLVQFFLKNYNEAISYFEKAQLTLSVFTMENIQNEYYYSFAEMYRIKGEAFMSLKDSERAIENFQNALELSNDSLNNALSYYNLGIVKSTLLNNSKEAIGFYTLAINNYPAKAYKEKSEALYNRGINYMKNGEPNLAIKDNTMAIMLRKDYFKAYNNRAVAKIAIKDYKGAISDCNQVIKLDNGLTDYTGMAYFNRGLSKLSLEDPKGCDDIRKAKSLGQSVSQEILDICK